MNVVTSGKNQFINGNLKFSGFLNQKRDKTTNNQTKKISISTFFESSKSII